MSALRAYGLFTTSHRALERNSGLTISTGTLAAAAQAAAAARSITNPDQQGWTLAAVAGALARVGQHEQAAAMARSITNPDGLARALAAVAEALAVRGDMRQACHVASAACVIGRWTTTLGLVLSLEPSAVGVLTDR